MEVKGTAIASLSSFIKEKFKDDGYKKWIESLSTESKTVYTEVILPSNWYPLTVAYSEPLNIACDLFYKKNASSMKESGKYSAESALKGVYKVFIKPGSPDYIINKAPLILQAYFKPPLVTSQINGSTALIKISNFTGMTHVIEHRLIGWIEHALELSNCTGITVTAANSNANGIDFNLKWHSK